MTSTVELGEISEDQHKVGRLMLSAVAVGADDAEELCTNFGKGGFRKITSAM